MYDAGDEDPDQNIPLNVVVLKGSVKGASGLPLLSNDERDGRAFFRVLYVEGGSKSTMFRCKTMIFNSEMSPSIESPSWSQGSFRFEMLVPEDEQGGHSLNGEILIAVYRSRWQGGNDFIGQAAFDLHDAVPMDMGYPGDIERNTLQGSYELIDRQGRVAGDSAEIALSLEFIWKVPPNRPETKLPATLVATTDDSARPPSGTLASKSKTGTKRPSSGGVRRVQSAQSAKRRTEAIKIELENKALQARIARNGTQAQKEKVAEMYKIQPTVGVIQSTAKLSDSKKTSSSMKKSSALSTGTSTNNPDELLQLLASVKTKAAAAEKENTILKAQVTNQKNLAKRTDVDIERMRRQELGDDGWYEDDGSNTREPLTDPLAIDMENISDIALKEMIGEHVALQESRRALVKRINQTKSILPELQSKQELGKLQLEAAWSQIDSAQGGDLNNTNSILLKEFRELEDNVKILEEELNADPEIFYDTDDKPLNEAIKNKLAKMREEYEAAKYERDLMQDRLAKLKEDAFVARLNGVMSTLRAALYRCQRQERTESLNHLSEQFESLFVEQCGLAHHP